MSGKWDDFSLWEKTPIKKNNESYIRWTTIGNFLGTSSFNFIFKNPSYNTDSDYIISESFDRNINGTVYQYKRLITVGNKGIVTRKIVLDSSLIS